MERGSSTQRDLVSFVVSALLHGGFVLGLVLIPSQSRQHYETVDLAVTEKPRAEDPEPPPPPAPPEEEPEPEPEKPRVRKAREPELEPPPPPAPPEEEPEPDKTPEAPPVFDLGDNTFAAAEGQGAAWSLQRSEGNTKLAALAKDGEPSVRDTRPKGAIGGVPGGTGSGPVPLKDLSRQPRPRNGSIAVPPYPVEARRDGIEGAVVLQVFIDKDGNVYRAKVVKDPGGGLGEIARVAMLKEKWTPPLNREGKPVSTVIIYSYRFLLDG